MKKLSKVHRVPSGNQYQGSLSITPDGRLLTNVLCGIPLELYVTTDEEIKELPK